MAKEAYYFSHDSNARHDPKITAMRGVYGSEGYGWYWMLVEMMRESEGYKLDMQGKYVWNAFALQLHSDSKTVEQFVLDCICEFNLFEADEMSFWSPSLMRRMNLREQKSEARRKAAKARWDKEKQPSAPLPPNANDMQMHSKWNPNAMQGKESKRKESKGKEIKEEHKELAPFDDIDLIKNRIHDLVRSCQIQRYTIFDLDVIYSFLGTMDVEVIEAAIKKSSGKQSINYAINTLKGFMAEGKTKKEHLFDKPAVGSRISPASRSGKPPIDIVSETQSTPQVSPEELEELRKLARKIDGNMREGA